MVETATNFMNYLDKMKIKYTPFPADEDVSVDVVRINKEVEGSSVGFLFFFDKNDGIVNVYSLSICTIPDDKVVDIYPVLNELNSTYHWVKFYIDENNEIYMAGDAVITENTSGPICFILLMKFHSIIEDALPSIMKVRWS